MLSRLTRHRHAHHTRSMKRHFTFSLLLLVLGLGLLAACAPGHSGDRVVAFIRDGKLWTIDPDGNNAFAVVSQNQPVAGYGWSPNHQLLAFRSLDENFNKTPEARELLAGTMAPVIADTPSTLNTIGVDGGTPISIAFSSPDINYSNPQWASNGTRLLYRQTQKNAAANPSNAQWWIAQNDQPGGIAAKPFDPTYSIPSISYDTQNYQILGNNASDIFTTDMAGSHKGKKGNVLPGHPLPSSLERLLWRPAHQNQSFLYAIEKQTLDNEARGQLSIQLRLRTLEGPSTAIATCTCSQFAWSPDGNYVLYSSGNQFTLVNIQDNSHFSIKAEDNAVPSWSPDSKFLLLDGRHSLSIVDIASKKQTQLLSDGTSNQASSPAALGQTNSLLQPIANSPWSSDSQQFIFLSHGRLKWQNQSLPNSQGLYAVSINQQGQIQDKPALITSGQITQPGWTYRDPNTSFLY